MLNISSRLLHRLLDDSRYHARLMTWHEHVFTNTMPNDILLSSMIGNRATVRDIRCSGGGFATLYHLVLGKVLVLVSNSQELPSRHGWPYQKMQWQAILMNPGDEL